MKSIRTNPSVHAPEGDERIRTAVCDGTNDCGYERLHDVATRLVMTPQSDDSWEVVHGDTLDELRDLLGLSRAAVARAGTEER